MINYGESFRYQREINGLSQTALAEATGLKHQNINRWERGIVLPNIDFCVKLADFFEISLDELVGRGDYMKLSKVQASHSSTISNSEQQLLEDFRLLPPNLQNLIRSNVDTLLKTQSVQKNDRKTK